MKFNWNRIEVIEGKRYNVANISPTAIIEVLEDTNFTKLRVNSTFAILSKDSSQGVPHLLEHSIFSNVINGKSLFEATEDLAYLGVDVNAFTSKDAITLEVRSGTVYNSDIYKDDKLYQNKAQRKNVKSYIEAATKIHCNLVSTVIPEKYYNKEKEIVCSEIDTNYSADALNIDKAIIPEIMYGGEYSSIGIKENVIRSTYEEVEAMRHMTFNNNKLKEIRMSVPYGTDLSYIEYYVEELQKALAINDEIPIDTKFIPSSIINDSCKNSEYVPEYISFQIQSIDGHINEKGITYDLKLVDNQKVTTMALFTLPSFKSSDLNVSYMQSLALLTFFDSFIEFYREKYPFMYRYDFWSRVPFRYEEDFYVSNTISAVFKDDLSIKEFNDTYEEYKKEFLKDNIERYINTLKDRISNTWCALLNNGFTIRGAVKKTISLNVINTTPLYGVTAEYKADLVRKSIAREEGKALPILVENFIAKDSKLIGEEVLNILESMRITFIKVSKKED